jgi:predicted ABC-type transport system involved in lysophospholipase L1 biosynthesis ATPase subunit
VLIGDGGSGLLLRLASLLEAPESGEILFQGEPTVSLDEAGRSALRSRHFGFVFSSSCLLPGLSAVENIAMPLFKVLQIEPGEAAERTSLALEFVGLRSIECEEVDSLGRLDQQRLALARALAHRPAVLVLERADAGLSGHEAAQLLDLVRRSREQFGVTVLTTFASEPDARRTERILAVEDGVICRDTAHHSESETHQSSSS